MGNKNRLFKIWLSATSIGILFFGFFMAFFMDLTTLPLEQSAVTKLILGILGSTMMGWAVMIFFVGRYAFTQKNSFLLKAILVGLIIWFIPDTVISVYLEAYFNVIINMIILVAALIPIIYGLKEF
jgi:hypothetical protein